MWLFKKLGETLKLRTANKEVFHLLRDVPDIPLQGSILSAPTSCQCGPCNGRLDLGDRRAHREAGSALDFPFPLPSQVSKTQVESPLLK